MPYTLIKTNLKEIKVETTFTELRNKQVINVLSGKVLGNVCDIVMDFRRNCLLGIIVPGSKSFFNIFKCSNEIYIPICNICKIGEDVILVEIIETNSKKKNKNVRVFDFSEISNNEEKTNEETTKNNKNC